MKALIVFVFGAMCCIAAPPAEQIQKQLDEIGRTATVMVDGDVCQRIVTKRALEFMTKKDPNDPYLDGDNYDVNDEPYIQV
jgi:hypothetical protein